MTSQIIHGNALDKLKPIPSNSVDEMLTDPPYGYSFMNKDWDKGIVSVEIWKECLRVLKPGAFAFIMSAPRQDVLSHMIVNLGDAGFKTDFTFILWSYASGFPKASNIGKMVDKKGANGFSKETQLLFKTQAKKLNLSLKEISKYFPSNTGGLTGCVWNWLEGKGVPTVDQFNKLIKILKLEDNFELIEEARREIIGQRKANCYSENKVFELTNKEYGNYNITKPSTDQAKKLDGSYAGCQPKPAVEVILVCMKPLSEKNYTEQAMKNGKGITWLDDCRIPFVDEKDVEGSKTGFSGKKYEHYIGGTHGRNITNENPTIVRATINNQGRFPANILVSDDALNDGIITKSTASIRHNKKRNDVNVYGGGKGIPQIDLESPYSDSGSFSRYFDVDKWQAQFLIVEKPSKSEKNAGLISKGDLEKFCNEEFDSITPRTVNDGRNIPPDNPFQRGQSVRSNVHPTVKPITLMSYLVTMGSREGETILDPFAGSGTTGIASSLLNRNFIGIEINDEYCKIAQSRLNYWKNKSFEKIEKIKKQTEKKEAVTLEAFV